MSHTAEQTSQPAGGFTFPLGRKQDLAWLTRSCLGRLPSTPTASSSPHALSCSLQSTDIGLHSALPAGQRSPSQGLRACCPPVWNAPFPPIHLDRTYSSFSSNTPSPRQPLTSLTGTILLIIHSRGKEQFPLDLVINN